MPEKQAAQAMVTVEILRVEKNKPTQILYVLKHSAHSLDAVFATLENVIRSPETTAGANAFHIVCDGGTEIYRWPSKGLN